MNKIDQEAIVKYKMPSIALMENAGAKLAAEAVAYFQKTKTGNTVVFCGCGNNGGDGMVCARHLIAKGYSVKTYILGAKNKIKADPAINMHILKKMKCNICELSNPKAVEKMSSTIKPDVVIDAIFGTGFSGKPDYISSSVIELINNLDAYVISADVPSGLNSTTGEFECSCVRADKTVAFGLPKRGFYSKKAKLVCGKVIIADIGLPNIC